MIEKDNIRENKEIDFYIDKKEQKQERQKKIDKKLNDIWILINVVFIICIGIFWLLFVFFFIFHRN